MRGIQMKKLCSLLLALVLLAGCALGESAPEFRRMGDAALLPYLENSLYEQLVSDLDSSDYFVENVQAVYISQEYLDELAFNSQENVYFGYTLSELNAQFQGEKYIFTLGENNETVAVPWTDYDDAYDRVIRNVAIGTGVILVCVTVSVVSAGVGAPAVSMIFAMAAKDSAVRGLLDAAKSGVPAFIATAVRTGDLQQAAREAALTGSEDFKWGAISGSISGGVTEAVGLKGAMLNGLSMNEAAQIQRESGYPLDVIKSFRTMEQYEVCQKAGLVPKMVDGPMALIRQIDLDFVDEMGNTNLERMQKGLAALDPATADKVMEITRSIVSENHLTTLMITHNLSQALTTGNRTIMLDEGRIILDLGGEERAKMGVNDLLDCYAEKKKKAFDNDRMMLAGTYFTAP